MASHLAFTFPGQGSQSVGMLAEMAASFPEVEDVFATASNALDYDLWKLVQQGPETELNRTERTQPALLAGGVALWRIWRRLGGAAPAVMAGHSLGEYTALVCAGALELGEAVGLVADRGRFMQEAVPSGVGEVAAVLGLDDARVEELCQQAARGEVVSAVNFNAPGQVVIAGHAHAVERALELAKLAGARRTMKLAVSVPVHCELMRPAAERLAARLTECRLVPPAIPVIHNVDVREHADPAALRAALARQLYSPVRWVETVHKLAARGVRVAVKIGPGTVLAGLNKRIEPGMRSLPVTDPEGLQRALAVVGEEG